ncbi:MAG: hypothetical protein OER95_04605, partial [Acidimicrobiia bacterium]|nr:hypothetical protein [Acidimicrobiia bacterium]
MSGHRRRTKHHNLHSTRLPIIVVLAMTVILATTLLAATSGAAAVTGIRVTAQSSFVAPNGSFVVEVAIDGLDEGDSTQPSEKEDLELAVTVFDRLREEAEIDQPPTRAASRLQPVPLSDLVPNNPGRYRLEIPV